jgi:hypothetical protein
MVLLLAACAAPLRDPWGLAVRQGQTPVAPTIPHTLQADLGILPSASGSLPFSARLYAEPGRRYRLDAFGFPSLVAASWLWEDDQWLLVRHDKREVRRGSGPMPETAGLPFRLPDLHAALGFLWGAPLPGFPGGDSALSAASVGADGVVRWSHKGQAWEALVDSATGLCREVRSSTLGLRYKAHRAHDGLVIPEAVEIFAEGKSLLTLNVRDWMASPPWKKDPFVLRIPEGYESVGGSR